MCSRQCRNNLHIDSTYTDDNVQNTHTYTQYTQCTIRHTYSYQYTLYTFCIMYTYIHSNMRRCNRKYISYVSWMCIRRTTKVFVFVQYVHVVQLNCVKVKVQCNFNCSAENVLRCIHNAYCSKTALRQYKNSMSKERYRERNIGIYLA